MSMKLNVIAMAVLALSVVATPATAQHNADRSKQPTVPVAMDAAPRLWFVELTAAPVADGTPLRLVQRQKAVFRAAARSAGIVYTERRSFDTLFNGFSVEVSPAERAKLARLPGVKALYPVEIIPAPQIRPSASTAPDMANALGLTGADIAQNVLGLSGQGVKVGIIDTGIDYDHPGFGGSGTNGTTAFPSARVVSGYDFVGDAFNADPNSPSFNPVPSPDDNPDDCQGHGTHVAGIVGANGGGIVGVAPQVQLGAYRVFGCAGSTTSDIIIAALERALADGMQVINQSLGAARQWPQYPSAQATSRLARKGVVMVASIGNNGPGGSSPDALFAAGAPGVGADVIGVASYDNGQRSFTVNDLPFGYNVASGAPLPPTSGSLPLARTGSQALADDACTALAPGSLTGQAALIRRGTCSFYIKASNAQAAGAAAVVLYNNAAGALNPSVAGTPPMGIPVTAITQAQGNALDTRLANGEALTLTWTTQAVGFPFGTGGLISGFSSFGLAADLSLKPQLGAPGGGILSTYPLERGATATLSGTSMSAPHVAGGAALILQAIPNAATGATKSVALGGVPAVNMLNRIQNTATPSALSTNAASGLLDHVHRQGAGMLDIVASVQGSTFVTPGQISLGESEGGAKTVKLWVRNTSDNPVTMDLSHRPATATGPNTQTGSSFNISGAFDAPSTVNLSASSLLVPARGMASFEATIAANDTLVDRGIYGGYITVTPQGGGKVVNVPFAGFKGDYQSTVVMTPTASNFPWLAKLTGTTFGNCAGTSCAFTMTGTDLLYGLVHFDHHSRLFRLEALDEGGNSLGVVEELEYFGRNPTPTGFFSFAWDGTINGAPVPNGTYRLRATVLKALGDAGNPAHWETWTSGPGTIARP